MSLERIWNHKCPNCLHDDSCLKSIVQKFAKNFAYGFALKFALRLVTERKPLHIM